jgi:hypothetical protein
MLFESGDHSFIDVLLLVRTWLGLGPALWLLLTFLLHHAQLSDPLMEPPPLATLVGGLLLRDLHHHQEIAVIACCLPSLVSCWLLGCIYHH